MQTPDTSNDAPWLCFLCTDSGTTTQTTVENAALDWLEHYRTVHGGRITSWQLLTAIGGTA